MDKYPKKPFKPFSFQSQLPLSASSLETYKNNCDELVSDFLEWLRFTEKRVLVFKRVLREKRKITADDVFVLPWSHRWSRFYMRKLKKRFSSVLDWYLDYNFVHLVITVPRSENIAVYMRRLKKAWESLRIYLTKKRGRFEFISVLEPQKNGFPHLHVLIFCDWFLIRQKELSDYLSSKGVGKICYIKRYWVNRWGKKPLFYLTKYLSKYWRKEEWNDAFLIFSAFLWFTRTRTISVSRGFFGGGLKRVKKEKEWELWFSCDVEEVLEVLKLANIDTDMVALPLYCCLDRG